MQAAIREMHRVLSKGGVLISVTVRWHKSVLAEIMQTLG